MDSCDKINAKDNTPPNRDEVRALYDSVRDIEASKNGYQLIRIKHGDYDWNFEDGQQYIDQILKQYKKEQGLYSINTSQNSLKKYDWRSLDIELQRIRLLYLKWLFHFNPIQCDALETCKYNNKVYIFDSPYGRSFSLSPAGIGNVYAGGGKGTLKLNHGSYDANNKLLRETDNIKLSLDRKVKQLKSTIESFVMDENYPLVWEYLQNFWWLRLGLHEFVFDVQFSSESLPTNDIREYILASIYNKIDLSKEIPSIFTDEQIIHSLRYKFSWNRYGVCSYDCGPLAFGREGFVPYKVAAHQIKKYFNENKIEFTKLSSINQKRSFAANSLSNLYDFQILYHEKPLGFYTHNDFKKNKEKLKLKITEVENILNKIATTEKLNLD